MEGNEACLDHAAALSHTPDHLEHILSLRYVHTDAQVGLLALHKLEQLDGSSIVLVWDTS